MEKLFGDQFGVDGKLVGLKRNALARIVLDYHSAQSDRVVVAGI